jgi:hypothetical protein
MVVKHTSLVESKPMVEGVVRWWKARLQSFITHSLETTKNKKAERGHRWRDTVTTLRWQLYWNPSGNAAISTKMNDQSAAN